jgi:hypothetical protein
VAAATEPSMATAATEATTMAAAACVLRVRGAFRLKNCMAAA